LFDTEIETKTSEQNRDQYHEVCPRGTLTPRPSLNLQVSKSTLIKQFLQYLRLFRIWYG